MCVQYAVDIITLHVKYFQTTDTRRFQATLTLADMQQAIHLACCQLSRVGLTGNQADYLSTAGLTRMHRAQTAATT